VARGIARLHGATAALVVACLCAGCDWPWRHDMADQPSPSAAAGPRPAARGSMPLASEGPFDPDVGESVVSPLQRHPSNAAKGSELYWKYCVPCHGPTGSGSDGAIAKYFPRVGDLRSSDVQRHGDGWLYAVITSGTQLMPAYGHELDPRERWLIVEFLRTLAH
jgi:mono/diheme cytochrome c family protein